jgi:hypothetical protein
MYFILFIEQHVVHFSPTLITFDQGPKASYSLHGAQHLTRATWYPIPYVVHYFWPRPYGTLFLCGALLLTTATWYPIPYVVHYIWPEPYEVSSRKPDPRVRFSRLYELCSKIVHYVGNRVLFGTHAWSRERYASIVVLYWFIIDVSLFWEILCKRSFTLISTNGNTLTDNSNVVVRQ